MILCSVDFVKEENVTENTAIHEVANYMVNEELCFLRKINHL